MYVLQFFKNLFSKHSVRAISSQMKLAQPLQIWKVLKNTFPDLKTYRKPTYFVLTPTNIPLLQVLAYIKHYDEIMQKIESKKLLVEAEIAQARTRGYMRTCQCCYDEEILPKNMVTCQRGCEFCKSCVQKSVEIAFGEGKVNFSCLLDCSKEFTLQTLQVCCMILKCIQIYRTWGARL